MRVTLVWKNCNDLDLRLTEPDGTEIWYGNTVSSNSGGKLDIDANSAGCDTYTPVENMIYVTGESDAPTGTYSARVNYYA